MTRKIFSALCVYLNVKNNRELAGYLEIPVTKIYGWVKRNKITDTGVVLAKNPELNVVWLRTGKGSMIRQGQRSKKQAETQDSKIDISHEAESFSITEMVTMTMEVLESDTMYRASLASNIRTHHKAVQMENEMNSIKEELVGMRQDSREMLDRMKRMEELLLSLGEEVPEKRDKIANS